MPTIGHKKLVSDIYVKFNIIKSPKSLGLNVTIRSVTCDSEARFVGSHIALLLNDYRRPLKDFRTYTMICMIEKVDKRTENHAILTRQQS